MGLFSSIEEDSQNKFALHLLEPNTSCYAINFRAPRKYQNQKMSEIFYAFLHSTGNVVDVAIRFNSYFRLCIALYFYGFFFVKVLLPYT